MSRAGTESVQAANADSMNIFGLFERRVGEALERLSASGQIPPGTYLPMVSSSETLPSSTNCSSTVAVTVLVRLPMRV